MNSRRVEALRRHLRGVKRRLFWVLVAFGLGASLTWYFRTPIILWLLVPGGELFSATGRPVFTNPTDMIGVMIQLAMKGGFVVAFPVLVYQVFQFLRPVLSKKHWRFLAIFLPAGFVCFFSGVAFAYFVVLPTGLRFLLQFGTDVADPMIRITEYMGLVMAMLFWLGVVFELPLAMFLLVRLRIVSYRRFTRFQRYVPVAAFLLSALITPTFDVVNSTLVAVPIIVLYEFGVFLAWMARVKQPKQRKPRQA